MSKIITLSPAAAKRLARTGRKVDGRANSNISEAAKFAMGRYWAEPFSVTDFPSADDTKYKWIYHCHVYATPFKGTLIYKDAHRSMLAVVLMLNTYETTNTETSASGYTIDTREDPPCSAITGVESIPIAGQRYPLFGNGMFKVTDDFGEDYYYYAFTERNNPGIYIP